MLEVIRNCGSFGEATWVAALMQGCILPRAQCVDTFCAKTFSSFSITSRIRGSDPDNTDANLYAEVAVERDRASESHSAGSAAFDVARVATQLRSVGPVGRPVRYYVGVYSAPDRSATAIAIVERTTMKRPHQDPLTWSFRSRARFRVQHQEWASCAWSVTDVARWVQSKIGRRALSDEGVIVFADAKHGDCEPVFDISRQVQFEGAALHEDILRAAEAAWRRAVLA